VRNLVALDSPKHRFFVPPEEVGDGDVQFSAQQAHQLANVLRLAAGDRVRVFDGRAETDHVVEITRLSSTAASGSIVGDIERAAEPTTRVVAYPALLARDKFDQVVQKLVEVGVASIVPVLSMRSLVRASPNARRRQRWQRIAQEAAEQSGRGIVPDVEEAVPLALALTRAAGCGVVLFAYEQERELPLRAALAQVRGRRARVVSLFVGPEGGYEPAEVALARAAGASIVSLGPRILRTETASPVLVAIVLYELERAGHASRP
jgi:16S rRNA (uracil1498-N3)-methyltransferase